MFTVPNCLESSGIASIQLFIQVADCFPMFSHTTITIHYRVDLTRLIACFSVNINPLNQYGNRIMLDYLTATVLSEMVYDAICAGATVGVDMLKSIFQNWIVDDDQICKIAEKMEEAGINENLNPKAIERLINQHPDLVQLLAQIHPSSTVTQTSHIGNNINAATGSNVSVGDIHIYKN